MAGFGFGATGKFRTAKCRGISLHHHPLALYLLATVSMTPNDILTVHHRVHHHHHRVWHAAVAFWAAINAVWAAATATSHPLWAIASQPGTYRLRYALPRCTTLPRYTAIWWRDNTLWCCIHTGAPSMSPPSSDPYHTPRTGVWRVTCPRVWR